MNIRGINEYSKFEKFKIMLSTLKFKFDIMVLGETKLKSTFPRSLYNLPGYDMYVSCRQCYKNLKGKFIGGGGLLVYVRKEIVVTKHEIFSSNYEKITFDLYQNKKKFKLISYYRPPESQKIKNINDFLNDVEAEISDNCERIMLIGDINIDITENCRYAQDYKNLINGYDMQLINNNVTRDISEKIIDHVVVNFNNSCQITVHTISLDKNFSDHNMIITSIEDMNEVKERSQTRSFDFLDYEKLTEYIHESQELKDIYKIKDVNEIARCLTEITSNAIKSSTKRINIKNKKESKMIPWLNRRIKKVQKEKRKIYKKLKKNRQCVKIKEEYKKVSQELKSTIKIEEKKFNFKSLMVKDPKVLWRNLNSILGKGSKDAITSVCNTNGKLVINKNELAESFNQYFIDSVNETVSSMSESRKPIKFISLTKSMGLEDTDVSEVTNAINSLKNVTPGIDEIKPQVLKFLINELSSPLCYLINRMFQTGNYPDIFKTAIVIPINKTGKKNDIRDYRPVSILTSFNKVIEKILYRRIMSFITKNNLLYCKQYGFREKSNTEVAAVELINEIRKNIDNKKKVSLVMMDVKKAFDSVNTKQLLDSLERCGIRGTALRLIENYLTNRKQIVKIGNNLSTARTVSNGVVQGGTLGSLLFLIFINEISQISLNGTLYMYADDALILNVHNKKDEIDEIVSNDVKSIIEFFQFKKLALNELKTNYMIIHSPYQKISDGNEIVVDEHFIMKRTRIAKYLGLILDENLKFDEHCKHLESKLTSSAAMLWKMRNKLPIYIKKKVYMTLFESHLLYMNSIWGTACDNAIKPLQSIQNRALRSVFNLERYANRTDMYTHKTENCLPIRGLNFMLTATYIYKNIHGHTHSNIKFTHNSNRRGRSSQHKELQCTASNTHYGHKSITSFGVKVFNSLPIDLKNLKHPAAFKWALRCYIRNENFMSSCFTNDYLKRFC
jgi:hypothetical protein